MTDTMKLDELSSRLATEQRTLLMQAAEAGGVPPAGALARIADLENTIVAIEAMIEGQNAEQE